MPERDGPGNPSCGRCTLEADCRIPYPFPKRTYELDTQTTVSAVSDLTKGLYSKDTIMQKAIEIQGASEIDVDFDKELKNLVQKGALLKKAKDARWKKPADEQQS